MVRDDAKASMLIVGGGFTGLAAAYELVNRGVPVTVLEAEADIGGLASSFTVAGEELDRFYHHWFTNDQEVSQLVREMGLQDRITISPTNTAVYYANHFFRLSTPADLLRFTPLGFVDRLRLGLLALRARRVRDWRELENKTAEEWLTELGGEGVYRVVWEPLLQGKFGPYSKHVSAVWFWNKLKLRGGSRGKKGEERLAYYQGGFIALARALCAHIRAHGGQVITNSPVQKIVRSDAGWQVDTATTRYQAASVLLTTALPLAADLIQDWASPQYLAELRRINYLANVCLVLELDRPLSDTYWLNVNDPEFPFVGVIEHTNFAKAETYGGRHIVYLSKYLPHTDPMYAMDADAMLDFALPYLQKMFPKLERGWIRQHHVWRARWSQPVVAKHYGNLIPAAQTPYPGLGLCSMAQIYPEDRGTNYAIREGRRAGAKWAETGAF